MRENIFVVRIKNYDLAIKLPREVSLAAVVALEY